ncbi:S-adenosylmethionine-dependent methyltransferase [Rhodotorula paludigena]|uniref:S-adenosylmethionine-dependent methyltransferase n=1 Tax=Rhodotorula paludigena TaxID=86838 RepID=UPI003173771B
MVSDIVERDKPLAYVLGTQPFHPLPVDLVVRPPTLIPRPETEAWLDTLTDRLLTSSAFLSPSEDATPSADVGHEPFRVLDIGTGSSCLALGLTYGLQSGQSSSSRHNFRPVHTLAVDRSPSALSLARENAERCGLLRESAAPHSRSTCRPLAHVDVRQSDLFAPDFASFARSALSTASSSSSSTSTPSLGFDLVVSNPPYITLAEYVALDASVKAWEDRGALVGEAPGRGAFAGADAADDGLVFYRRIVSLLDELLRPPQNRASRPLGQAGASSTPAVAFEVGQGQARAVQRLLQDWSGIRRDGTARRAEFGEVEVIRDPWGVERAVFASW